VPTLYDISGSAHWYNKADNGITVYRHMDADMTDIYVGKIRFREVGQRGKATLAYCRHTGTYHERRDEQLASWSDRGGTTRGGATSKQTAA
jgi:twinkle protein